ncbi:MAG: SMEK domain-containing protein [Sedimentisphaerales bacterium]|nr:SMEK domain-containing protein [Sedimentisphaerales bacterium]
MNRAGYFNFIEEKLSFLATRIELRGRLNILDLNLHSETFYQHFFNLIFDWHLENLNKIQPNAPAVDLIDTSNKLIIAVSATATKQKIESALNKDISNYKDYFFKFISISKDAKILRSKTFSNPYNLVFSPANDIFDINSLLALIKDMDTDKLKKIYDFLKKELKSEPDPEKMESNLTTIINILSKEDWSQGKSDYQRTPFEIEEKITYNQLNTARSIIDDYKIHHFRIEKIYSEFDKQGVNKSISILDGIRTEYLTLLGSDDSPDQCFFSIIEKVKQKIQASANFKPMPEEELMLSVGILVVDAFVRCKIFRNPLGNSDARS